MVSMILWHHIFHPSHMFHPSPLAAPTLFPPPCCLPRTPAASPRTPAPIHIATQRGKYSHCSYESNECASRSLNHRPICEQIRQSQTYTQGQPRRTHPTLEFFFGI